jgi:lysophospholipase L1-like esterase
MPLKSKFLATILSASALLFLTTIAGNRFTSGFATRAQTPAAPIANFRWSMPDRFGPPDKNGVINYHWSRKTHLYDPSFINPATWTVDFNACSTAAEVANVQNYTWEIQGETFVRQQCTFSYSKFTHLGQYPVKLTVTAKDGQTSAYQETVNVRDIVIVSLGDSFASGQGNPDIKRDKESDTDPQWVYSRCHRSAKAGPAIAARRIEEVDLRTSVTFVSYACSGARIRALTKSQKKGVVKLASQIDQVRKVLAGRTIDAVIISVGGNDLSFARLVAQAVAYKHFSERKDTKRLFEKGLKTLPASYVELRDALGKLFPTPKILITEYPDLVRDQQGKYCDSAPPNDKLLKRITGDEAEWASQTVITNLNCEVSRAAKRHGWIYVDGIQSGFFNHGYCADDDHRWVNTFVDANRIQGTSRCRETGFGDCIISPGSVHPNEAGHQCIATRILLALKASGVVDSPNLIRPTDLCKDTPSSSPVRRCLLDEADFKIESQ